MKMKSQSKGKSESSTKSQGSIAARKKAKAPKASAPKPQPETPQAHSDAYVPLQKAEYEIFAQALADGKTEYEAYMMAYPKATKRSARSSAPRLLANVVVRARVCAIKEQNAALRGLTREKKRQILYELATGTQVSPKDKIAAIVEDNRMTGATDDKPAPPSFNITFVKE